MRRLNQHAVIAFLAFYAVALTLGWVTSKVPNGAYFAQMGGVLTGIGAFKAKSE